VTFRVDDLLVAVLPEQMEMEKDKGCPQCSKCTNRTATPTPCGDRDPNTENCLCIAPPSEQPAKKTQSWRDEQFDLLSRELDEALTR
jgi:hypothetical protein